MPGLLAWRNRSVSWWAGRMRNVQTMGDPLWVVHHVSRTDWSDGAGADSSNTVWYQEVDDQRGVIHLPECPASVTE